MSKQFLHISFEFADGDPKIKELKPVFDKALDWYRYVPNCWIIWTARSATHWYERLKPYLSDGDHVFIVRLDISERQGWLSKSFWEWLREDRNEST